ncbi:MAG: hypothetical protein LBR19_06800, partial [Bifidobacteriaceae bacterium]|nr:hypothetical protein [Bifidobacteriaceae bacterium]
MKRRIRRALSLAASIALVAGTGVAINPAAQAAVIPAGAVKVLDDLASIPIATSMYPSYAATGRDNIAYYQDGTGSVYVVSGGGGTTGSQLKVFKYDAAFTSAELVTAKTYADYPVWGGFHQGTDGNFYVVVGHDNITENDAQNVIGVYKYNAAWTQTGVLHIKSGDVRHSTSFKGIYEVFRSGNLRMATAGGHLYIDQGRSMYAQSDGLNHQTNLPLDVNTSTLTYTIMGHYQSHSFNQFVLTDGSTLYFLNHGDGYNRALELAKYNLSGGTATSAGKTSLITFDGTLGQNATGTTAT